MDKHNLKKIMIIGFILLLGFTGAVIAQEEQLLEDSASLLSETESDPELNNNLSAEIVDNSIDELKDYFELYFNNKIAEYNLPGLAYAFVHQGQIITRGYGYGDLENQVLIDPETTIFPFESITKALTATAVLQMAQKQNLDLTRDVNHYLDRFQFNTNYPRPITLSNLLTHSSGLANDPVESYARERWQIEPLADYLAENVPKRISTPTKISMYGDYGYAVAGYLIEEVSGLKFEEYMAQQIFQPLNMTHSSYNWDLSNNNHNEARGYLEQKGQLERQAKLYAQLTPALALTGTVRDMANFIMMELQEGTFNRIQVLAPEYLAYQQEPQFSQHSQLASWTFGFNHVQRNGQSILLHGGDNTAGYSSIMFILPEADFGMIVATNNFVPRFGTEVVNDFLDWRYPAKELESLVALEDAADRRTWFTGNYTLDYPDQSSLIKLRRLFTQIHVIAGENGTIVVDFPEEMDLPEKWIEVEPLLFRAVETNDYFVFIEDCYGKITHLYAGGPYNFSRVSWYQTTELTLVTLLFFVVTFVIVSLVWLVRKIRGRKRRSERLDNFHQNMAFVISLLNLGFIAGMVLYICFYSQELITQVSTFLSGLLVVPLVSTGLTLLLVVIGSSRRKHNWSFGLRVYHFLISIILVLFLVFLWNWNLVF